MAEGVTQGTELSSENANLASVRAPAELSYEWPPRGIRQTAMNAMPPPPPELKRFVRSMSVLGVPVKEIARRVQQRIGTRSYHMRSLYRDFAEDLLPRMKRGPRGSRRVRLIEKPPGWKPMLQGSPFSYADVLAILQSDLDSRDLARLYGVNEVLIYKMRRGESKLTQYILPRIMITKERIAPKDMAYRARVTSDIAVKLVQQMRDMVAYSFGLIEEGVLADPVGFDAPKKSVLASVLYRRNPESGALEERTVTTTQEKKAAKLSGWTEEKP